MNGESGRGSPIHPRQSNPTPNPTSTPVHSNSTHKTKFRAPNPPPPTPPEPHPAQLNPAPTLANNSTPEPQFHHPTTTQPHPKAPIHKQPHATHVRRARLRDSNRAAELDPTNGWRAPKPLFNLLNWVNYDISLGLEGYSPHKPPFGVRLCEVVRIHPVLKLALAIQGDRANVGGPSRRL